MFVSWSAADSADGPCFKDWSDGSTLIDKRQINLSVSFPSVFMNMKDLA